MSEAAQARQRAGSRGTVSRTALEEGRGQRAEATPELAHGTSQKETW